MHGCGLACTRKNQVVAHVHTKDERHVVQPQPLQISRENVHTDDLYDCVLPTCPELKVVLVLQGGYGVSELSRARISAEVL